ncbi:hypothetical protein [uncultured Microbacterium sp.]|uniref:tyrosine-type recombinase/integrase n=1 Tax=uncultured Microbacterium sp. TaxID=191216 RepID=UPI0025D855D2|nr:hypothetical protein [uncultured Microbacterium sp.]
MTLPDALPPADEHLATAFERDSSPVDEHLQERNKHARKNPKPWRRPNGEGSIFPVTVTRKSGKAVTYYRGARRIVIGDQRHRVVVQATSYQAARQKLEDKVLELRVAYGLESADKLPVPKEFDLLTVEKCMYDWLEEKNANGDLKPASYRMYDARIRNHILPVFGTHPVRTLTYDQLKEFFKVTLPAKDLGVSSIRQTFVALKSALDYYQRDRIITAHPMTGLKVPRAKVLDKKDKTQIRRASKFLNEHLLKWAREEDAEARWFLALLGLRQGEVLGMTDDSLVTRGSGSSRTRRVVIKHQLQHESAAHGCGHDSAGKWLCGGTSRTCPQRVGDSRWVLASTKSQNSEREIVITEPVWDMLIRHRNKQRLLRKNPEFKPASGEGLDRLLFTRENGQPIYATRDRAQLTKIIEKHKRNLPDRMTVHTLRHVATTRLLEGGMASREDLITMMGWSPKNADAQIAIYSSADHARQAARTTMGYIEGFYSPAPEPPVDGDS